MLVADELRVPLSAVRLVMGDTDLCPYDEGTFGSSGPMSTTTTAGDPIAPSASPLHEPKQGTRWQSVRATFADGICSAG